MQIRANGIRVEYTVDGPAGAPVVVLSHSLAARSAMWAPQAAALVRRYRVVAYDTRGHGATEAPAGPYSLELLARDGLALLDALGLERVHWVGLSMGGMIGQTLALLAPGRLASLALCDTSSRVPPEARAMWAERIRNAEAAGMAPLVEATIGRWFTAPFIQSGAAVVDTVRGMIGSTPVAGYAGCCHAIAALDLTARLGEIRLPTLVIVGADDQGTPVSASETIQRGIPGSELVVLPSAAHLSNLEQPEAFTAALERFLARTTA